VQYQSSRGIYSAISAAEAITKGISPDGGLFVPDYIPTLDKEILTQMQDWTYQERAAYIMSFFLTDFTEEEISQCVYGVYNFEKFDHEDIVPLIPLNDSVHIQELWHGPTCAFKDMALQILPYLLTVSAGKIGESNEIVILVATSGDTGKAALEGFRDVDGTSIIVFYPEDGVSEVQKRQMVTQEGKNVYVAGVKGNFDDAQNGVKRIFGNKEIIKILAQNNKKMSSANSINWGRLLPQIIYYVSAYVDLCAQGLLGDADKINIVVPTGNFGNILAAFYAGKMGVPVNRLICAANANNVLTDFIKTGVYDRKRKFKKTISPSMDILISSNLERLLYELTGHDSNRVSNWMSELQNKGRYEVDAEIRRQIQEIFWSDFSTDKETIETIRSTWNKYKYLIDTHTAVAVNVHEKYQSKTGDETTTIIASTASPFKFASSVAQAILPEDVCRGHNEFEILEILSEYAGIPIPAGIKNLDKREIRHKAVTTPENMENMVIEFCK